MLDIDTSPISTTRSRPLPISAVGKRCEATLSKATWFQTLKIGRELDSEKLSMLRLPTFEMYLWPETRRTLLRRSSFDSFESRFRKGWTSPSHRYRGGCPCIILRSLRQRLGSCVSRLGINHHHHRHPAISCQLSPMIRSQFSRSSPFCANLKEPSSVAASLLNN